MSINLKRRNLSKNRPARETGEAITGGADPGHHINSRGHSRHGARKIDKKPVSSRRTSHWKLRNTCPATVRDRYKIKSRTRESAGAIPRIRTNERTTPPPQRKCRKP